MRWGRQGRAVAVLAVAVLALHGCTDDEPGAAPSTTATSPTGSTPATPPTSEPTTEPTSSATTTPTPTPTPEQPDAARAYADVVALADGVGPREATSASFQQAAQLVEDRFVELGYEVRRQEFRVPAGTSWGVDVPAGTSTNLVATLPGTRLDARHVVVGAHLDTVPQAPGAEDNASGVAAVLELARLVAADPPALPVVLVAFGAEEPRGDGDDLHHFGSQAYVAAMTPPERSAAVGLISLDRVGVGEVVPISSGGVGPLVLRDALVAGAQAAGVPHLVDEPNRSSDHWSFERNGLTGARLGSTPYAGYHSAGDVPSVVSQEQLGRVITIAWTTLQALTAA